MVLPPNCGPPACSPSPQYCIPPLPFVPSCYLPSLCYPPPCPTGPPPQIYYPTPCTPQPCPPPPPKCCPQTICCPSPPKQCCPRPQTGCQSQCPPRSGCCGGGGGGGCGGGSGNNNSCNRPIVCVPIQVQTQACVQMGCRGGNGANRSQKRLQRKRRYESGGGGINKDKQQSLYNNCNFYMNGIPKELCDQLGLGFRGGDENCTDEDGNGTEEYTDETSEDLSSGRDEQDEEYEDCVDEGTNTNAIGCAGEDNFAKCPPPMNCWNPWAAFFMGNCFPGGFPFGMCGPGGMGGGMNGAGGMGGGMNGPGGMYGNGGRGRGFGPGRGGGRGRGTGNPFRGRGGGYNGNGRGGRGSDPYGRGRRFSDGRGGDDGRGRAGGYNDGRGGGYNDGRGGGNNEGRGGEYSDNRGDGYNDGRGGGYDEGRGRRFSDGRDGYDDNERGGVRSKHDIDGKKSSQNIKGATSRIFKKMSGYRPYPYSNAELTTKPSAYATKNTSCSTVAATSTTRHVSTNTSAHRGVSAASSHRGVSAVSDHRGVSAASSHRGVSTVSEHRGVYAASSHRGVSAVSDHRGVSADSSHRGVSAVSDHRGVGPTSKAGILSKQQFQSRNNGLETNNQNSQSTAVTRARSEPDMRRESLKDSEKYIPIYRSSTQTRLQIVERANEPSEIRVIQKPVQEVVSYQRVGPPAVDNSRVNLNVVTEDGNKNQPDPNAKPKNRGRKRASDDPCHPRRTCMQYHTRRLHRLCSFANRRTRRLSQIHKPLFSLRQPPCPIRETVGSILRKWPPARCRFHIEEKVPAFHDYCRTDNCPDVNRYPLLTRELSPLCHEYYANKEGALEENKNQNKNEQQKQQPETSQQAQASHQNQKHAKKRGKKRKRRHSC